MAQVARSALMSLGLLYALGACAWLEGQRVDVSIHPTDDRPGTDAEISIEIPSDPQKDEEGHPEDKFGIPGCDTDQIELCLFAPDS